MNEDTDIIRSQRRPGRGAFITYVTGYLLSLYLTLTSYLLVTRHMGTAWTMVWLIVGLALVQFWVQLMFFLHLGQETRPRWRLLIFSFMTLVVLILVFGSLWIMTNLNYRMMGSPEKIKQYMQSQVGL